jgi:hypothetical protein
MENDVPSFKLKVHGILDNCASYAFPEGPDCQITSSPPLYCSETILLSFATSLSLAKISTFQFKSVKVNSIS